MRCMRSAASIGGICDGRCQRTRRPDGRSPQPLIGSFGGALKTLTAANLGAVVVKEAILRVGIDDADIDDVILGCVLQGGGMNIARQSALQAGLPADISADTINRVCGSGLQGGDSRRRCGPSRIGGPDCRGRCRVDEQRTLPVEAGLLGTSDEPR